MLTVSKREIWRVFQWFSNDYLALDQHRSTAGHRYALQPVAQTKLTAFGVFASTPPPAWTSTLTIELSAVLVGSGLDRLIDMLANP